jgi:hypothetical protein
MPKPENIAQAGLVGWRKAIADNLAPRAASRAPVSEERLRAAIGAAFFLLSLYYVACRRPGRRPRRMHRRRAPGALR